MPKKRRKQKTSITGQKPSIHNPVAKHAHKSNRSWAFLDRTRYRRQLKHKNLEPFPVTAFVLAQSEKVFGFLLVVWMVIVANRATAIAQKI